MARWEGGIHLRSLGYLKDFLAEGISARVVSHDYAMDEGYLRDYATFLNVPRNSMDGFSAVI
jgi:hypothetical protein